MSVFETVNWRAKLLNVRVPPEVRYVEKPVNENNDSDKILVNLFNIISIVNRSEIVLKLRSSKMLIIKQIILYY